MTLKSSYLFNSALSAEYWSSVSVEENVGVANDTMETNRITGRVDDLIVLVEYLPKFWFGVI